MRRTMGFLEIVVWVLLACGGPSLLQADEGKVSARPGQPAPGN